MKSPKYTVHLKPAGGRYYFFLKRSYRTEEGKSTTKSYHFGKGNTKFHDELFEEFEDKYPELHGVLNRAEIRRRIDEQRNPIYSQQGFEARDGVRLVCLTCNKSDWLCLCKRNNNNA